jgi:hypothetical protein
LSKPDCRINFELDFFVYFIVLLVYMYFQIICEPEAIKMVETELIMMQLIIN